MVGNLLQIPVRHGDDDRHAAGFANGSRSIGMDDSVSKTTVSLNLRHEVLTDFELVIAMLDRPIENQE